MGKLISSRWSQAHWLAGMNVQSLPPNTSTGALAVTSAPLMSLPKPGGGAVEEISFGGTGYNGVGLSPDERAVYAAETFTGRLIAFDLAGPGQVAKGGRGGRLGGTAPGRAFFDSLAVQANGDVCVASIADGITTVSPDGTVRQTPLPDGMVTNICFGGADLRDAFITLSETGRLIKMRWPEAGLKLNFAA